MKNLTSPSPLSDVPTTPSVPAAVAKPKASDLMPLGAALQVVEEAREYVGYDGQRDSSLALVVVEDERLSLLEQFRQVVAANHEYEAANDALKADNEVLLEALRGLLLDEDCAKGAELSTNVCRIYVKVDALDAARSAIAKATGARDYRRAKGEIE